MYTSIFHHSRLLSNTVMPNTEINYPGAVQLKTPKSCLTPFYTQKSIFLVFIVLRYELLIL
jgi:hypothetical protein